MIYQKGESPIGYKMNLVLDRIYQVCNRIQNNIKQPTSFKHLLKQIRKGFSSEGFDVAFKPFKTKDLDNNQFYIEAYYFEETDFSDDPPIEVQIYHYFGKDQKFYQARVNELLIQIYDAVIHEIKHQMQYHARKCKHYTTYSNDYMTYLADPDEIDAYALSVAVELLRSMPKHRAMLYMTRLTALSNVKYNGILASPSLNSYVSYFKDHRILKKLAKKVYLHLELITPAVIFK